MIIKGDKIKLVQKLGNFDKVGDVFTVTGVDSGVISFNCSYGTGCMTYDEFKKYFEKVENPVISKRTWTKWKLKTVTFLNPFNGISCAIDVQMRENGKKVQVRFDHLRAEASCYKDDKFDVSKGFDLAKRRLVIKLLDNEVKEYAKGF